MLVVAETSQRQGSWGVSYPFPHDIVQLIQHKVCHRREAEIFTGRQCRLAIPLLNALNRLSMTNNFFPVFIYNYMVIYF